MPLENQHEYAKVPVGISDLNSIIRRHLLKLLLLSIAGFVGGYMYASSLPNIYQASTKIVLQPRDTGLFETLPETAETNLNDEAIATELEIINSRILAERIVDNLKLVQDPSYNVYLGRQKDDESAGDKVSGWLNSILTWVRLRPRNPAADQDDQDGGGNAAKGTRVNAGSEHPSFKLPGIEEQRQATTTRLMSAVEIGRFGRSMAISVSVSDTSPERAAAIANSIAVEYLEMSVEKHRETTEKAIAFLAQRAEDLGAEVSEIEQKIADYTIQNRLTDPQYTASLRAEIEQLKVQLQIAENAGNTSGPLDAETIREELRKKSNELDERNRAEIELRQMERLARSGQDRYEQIISRLGNLDLQAEPLNPRGKILSFAQVPNEAISPKRLLLSFVGAAAGILLAILLIIIREGTDKRVLNELQVEKITDVPIFTLVPELKNEKWGAPSRPFEYISKKPFSHYSDAVRQLLAGCRFMMSSSSSPFTVMLTSSIQDEGKTTTAVSLAVTAAREERKTILIDIDYHKCGASRAVGIPQGVQSLDEVLTGACGLQDAIYTHPEYEFLDAIGFADFPSDIEGMHNREAMEKLLRELKKKYQLIVIDTPPVLMASNATFMASLVDLIVVVVRWARTDTEMLSSVLKKVRTFSNVVPLGIALNRVDFSRLAKMRHDPNAKYQAYADSYYYRN